jgi:hypothetical protein
MPELNPELDIFNVSLVQPGAGWCSNHYACEA